LEFLKIRERIFWFTEKLSVMLCSNLDVFSFASAHGQVFRRCPHKLSAAALADVSPTEMADVSPTEIA
jgi:hypothetical protein